MPLDDFAKKVSEAFKTTYHSDWRVRGPSRMGHYFVIGSKQKIIFNFTEP